MPADLLPTEDTLDVQDWPLSSGFFTLGELALTESTAWEVVQNIANGEWKAESSWKQSVSGRQSHNNLSIA